MPVERSFGVIIFRKDGGKNLYLLLHAPGRRAGKDFWDFPKGHINDKEKPIEAAKREAVEETGLVGIEVFAGFKETIKYFFKAEGKNIMKFVTFFLAETKTSKIKISPEHTGFLWLPYKEALEQLTFKNAKGILEKANKFLT